MSALTPVLLAAAFAAASGTSHFMPPNVPASYIPWTPTAADDVNSLKHASLLKKSAHHHKHKGKNGKMVEDKDDDDDDDFPKIHFHFHTPSYGGFKMDEGATILHTMLGKLADDDYLKFAALVATNHSLSTNTKVTDRLKGTLSNLQKGGADFLLAAAGANFPNMPEQTRRKRFIEMLSAAIAQSKKKQSPQISAKPVLKNATKAVVGAVAKGTASKPLTKPALKSAKVDSKATKAPAIAAKK
jgi:hypothetical protein